MGGDQSSGNRRGELRDLLESLVLNPALVYDRHLTVVESNRLAVAVAPGFEVGSNLARFTFLPPTADTRASDWFEKRDQVAALLRESLSRHPEDSVYLDLVGELATTSDDFAAAWAAEPSSRPGGEFLFTHEATGEYRLAFHLFRVGGPWGDTLVIWNASDALSLGALKRLARE